MPKVMFFVVYKWLKEHAIFPNKWSERSWKLQKIWRLGATVSHWVL